MHVRGILKDGGDWRMRQKGDIYKISLWTTFYSGHFYYYHYFLMSDDSREERERNEWQEYTRNAEMKGEKGWKGEEEKMVK